MPDPAAPALASTETAESLESLHLKAMNAALKALLDRVPGSRRALPHLAALEMSLRKNGLNSVRQASLPVLQKVLAQLTGMPDVANDPGLQSLQAALLSAIARQQPPHPKSQLKSLGDADQVVEVRELSQQTFMLMANGLPTSPGAMPAPEVQMPR
jgi:hypothetical protein